MRLRYLHRSLTGRCPDCGAVVGLVEYGDLDSGVWAREEHAKVLRRDSAGYATLWGFNCPNGRGMVGPPR